MKRIQLISVLFCLTAMFSAHVHATASYSATSTGTLTLLSIDPHLVIDFFGPSPAPEHSNTAFPGIQVFGNGGTPSHSILPVGGTGFSQMAGVSGSQTLPGFVTTDVLTTVLLDVSNPTIDIPGSFTVRWDWSLGVMASVDNPVSEIAHAVAGVFLRDATPGSPLMEASLEVFDIGTETDSGSSIFTVSVAPMDRNIVITAVDANGSAVVIPVPPALVLLATGLLLVRRSLLVN